MKTAVITGVGSVATSVVDIAIKSYRRMTVSGNVRLVAPGMIGIIMRHKTSEMKELEHSSR